MIYWALTDPDLGETLDSPGGLVRYHDGLFEVLLEDGTWEDRGSYFAALVFDPTSFTPGTVATINPATASHIEAAWPSPRLRSGFRTRHRVKA